MPLKCINGIFSVMTECCRTAEVEKEIYRMVKPVLTERDFKKVKQFWEVLKTGSLISEELPVIMDHIHVEEWNLLF